jgi:hypothetical protein
MLGTAHPLENEMITPNDMHFHLAQMNDSTTEATRYLWAETFYAPFAVPERRLFGCIYLLARPGLGVMLCDIKVFEGISRSRLDASYSDNQQQLPAPADFRAFSLPNGLSVDLTDGPDRYQVRYQGLDNTSIDLSMEALMPAFDIHDPTMDPRARASTTEQISHSGYGASYSGHYDQICRIRGTLILRGETIAVDYVDCMDRSWGPRPEIGAPDMCWMHAIFGADYCVHGIWQLDPTAARDKQYSFAHGFVLENGTVYGLTDGRLDVDREDEWGAAYSLHVTDRRGKQHTCHGAPIASGLWACYPSIHVPNLLNRWISSDGRVGYGELQDGIYYDRYISMRAQRAIPR